MLQQPCCRNHATATMPQQPCHSDHAAATMPQQPCCSNHAHHSHAAATRPWPPLHQSHAAATTLHCSNHAVAAATMPWLQQPCHSCSNHAMTMPTMCFLFFAPSASMSSAPKPSTAINLCIDCISTKAVYAGWLQFDSFLYHAMAGFCNQGKSKMTTNLPLCNAGVAVGSLLFDCATREKSQNNNQPVHQIDCFLLSLYFPK